MSEHCLVSRARCSAQRSGAVRRRTGTDVAGPHRSTPHGPRISAAPARNGAPLQRIRGTRPQIFVRSYVEGANISSNGS